MPEVIVLDSHIWFWWINLEHERLPAGCRDRIEQAERVGVSPVSCYELALAHRRGRLQLPCASAKWFAEALAPAGVDLIPLRRLAEKKARDHAGFLFVFKARRQAHSRAM
jgi:PIN domain nuclease of toxin-antitoxin system